MRISIQLKFALTWGNYKKKLGAKQWLLANHGHDREGEHVFLTGTCIVKRYGSYLSSLHETRTEVQAKNEAAYQRELEDTSDD